MPQMMTRQAMVRAVAENFCTILHEELSKKDFAEMKRRNDTEMDANICHSHDFIDANEVMLRAIQTVGFTADDCEFNTLAEKPTNFQEYQRMQRVGEASRVWDDAWKAAKKVGYWAPYVANVV